MATRPEQIHAPASDASAGDEPPLRSVSGGDPRWLAWYAQAKLHSRLLERLGADMERRTGLPSAWGEVLACLASRGPIRMNELADDLLVSRGGATRIVARMEDAGLVERETPPSDRRATYARLTPAGLEAFGRWLPVHLELVHELFGRHVDPTDVEVLVGVAAKVSAAHGWPHKTLADLEAHSS
jgi:DNA-binding MarR family transcriptional regulator